MRFWYLDFLASPWFVIPWYTVGILSALWIIYDVRNNNVYLNKALKIGWPIIAIFFSIISLVLYLETSRPPHTERKQGDENKKQLARPFIALLVMGLGL